MLMEKNRIKICHSDDGLAFNTGSINLSGGVPDVTILEGSEEKTVKLEAGECCKKAKSIKNAYCGRVEETSYTWLDKKGYSFTWTVGEMKDHNGFTLKARFYNGTQKAVRLSEFVLCKTDDSGMICDGNASDWVLSTLNYDMRIGNLEELLPSINEYIRQRWEGYGLPEPRLPDDEKSNNGKWRIYTDFITLYKDNGKTGIVISASGEPEADVRFDCMVDSGKIRLSIVSEMNDIIVEPGQWRSSQEVVLFAGEYGMAVETILRWIAATHGSRHGKAPVYGWCSWYDLGQRITAESILATIGTVAEMRKSGIMQVIQVDDGYQRTVGNWACNEKFTCGLAHIAEKIMETGATAGVWLAPLAVHESTGMIDKYPDWFQRDKNGDLLGEGDNWGLRNRWLDPSHPNALQFIRDIIRNAKKDGFRYFKIDFNTIQGSCRFYNPYKTSLQVYRDLYDVYRREIGEEAYLLACAGLNRGVIGFVDSSRTGPDSCAIWEAKHPCTIKEAIRAIGMNAAANGILFSNDPDVTYIRPRGQFNPIGLEVKKELMTEDLTVDEWQTWHSFVGLLGGTAMISDPVQSKDYKNSIRMFEILTPPSREKGQAFYGGTDIWHKRFGSMSERPWGSAISMLLWNPEKYTAQMEIGKEIPGLPGEKFHIWSFWDEKYLGIGDKNTVINDIAPHGCKLLRLTDMLNGEGLPAVIGSNLHISMGAEEIRDFRATSQAVVLNLGSAGAVEGRIYLYTGSKLKVKQVSGCTICSLYMTMQNVWKIEIADRDLKSGQLIVLSVEA